MAPQRRRRPKPTVVWGYCTHKQSDQVECPLNNAFQKKELGPYAFEDRMPDSMVTLLQSRHNDSRVWGPAGDGLRCIPLLKQLAAQDPRVGTALFCHQSVRHIGKIKGEGNHFCGYHNIQMLSTYALESCDALPLRGSLPDVIELQDLIERAWDRGFNSRGRMQTGGIRCTRKHIGTQEVRQNRRR